MARAFNPKTIHDYVPKSDRDLPKEQQTVFHFRLIDVYEDMELSERFKDRTDAHLLEYTIAVLSLSLTGWDNFPLDEAGTPTPFERDDKGQLTPETVRSLGRLIVELFSHCLQLNGMTPQIVGKSLRRSTTLAGHNPQSAQTAAEIQPVSAG